MDIVHFEKNQDNVVNTGDHTSIYIDASGTKGKPEYGLHLNQCVVLAFPMCHKPRSEKGASHKLHLSLFRRLILISDVKSGKDNIMK